MDNIIGLKRTCYCNDVKNSDIGKKITLMGWVQRYRDLGGLKFVDLRDRSGIIQLTFDTDYNKEAFDKADKLGSEYVIAVVGEVRERSSKNKNIPTGDIEVIVCELRILNEAETPPIYVKDDDDVSEDLRLKYRFLDLRKPKMQYNLYMRHKTVQAIHKFLSDYGFLEIETPILGKTTPEGARDYLVPSRVNKGRFYGLPQSPQLFKQLLMVSGADRYFQIAKCFRDEDLRADRQPEFTQVDCEMSFVEADDVMDMTERMLKSVFKETLNMDIKLPLRRMKWYDAMNDYGSDKPDVRFDLKIKDVSEIFKNSEFKTFTQILSSGGTIRAINIEGHEKDFSRKQVDALGETAKLFGLQGISWIRFTEDGIKSSISKFLTEEIIQSLTEKLKSHTGDLIILAAGTTLKALTALGRIRLEVGEKLGLIDHDKFEFLFVVEFPLFEYSEEENRYVAAHHPFTAPLDEDLKLFETAPEKMRAKAYDIVLNGVELGGGSIRIYQGDIQKKMFKAIGLKEEEAKEKFDFLLEAFKYGAPPHGGIALGLDRMLMLMLKRDSIREVIAFPKNQNAVCPLTQAPSKADEKALKELGIKFD